MDYLTSPASTSTSSSSPVSSTISSTISPLPHQQYNNYSSSTDFDEPSSSPSRNNNRTLTTTTTVTPTLASTLSDIEGRIKQINDLYAQKTRRLVAAVSRLQDENQALKASTKEHNRSAYITTLQNHNKERELIVDVLKEGFGQSTGRTKAEVDEWITKKTLSGPTRFRPKSREELGIEISYLENQLTKASQAIEGLETTIKTENNRQKEDTTRLTNASNVISQQTTLLNDYKLRLEYGEEQIQSYQLTIFELNNQITLLKDLETKAKQVGERYIDTKNNLKRTTTELDDCKDEISKLKAYIQTLESNGRSTDPNGNYYSKMTGRSLSSPDGKHAENSDPFPSHNLNTLSTLSSASISDLNLNNPQEAEIYVQKLRAHYGREINELRNHLELLRTTIVENNSKRKQEQEEWQNLLERQEKTITTLKEQHRNELELVRTELQRSLQTMKQENEEDMQTLRTAHTREMETLYEQIEAEGGVKTDGKDNTLMDKFRDTLRKTQDELDKKSKEYSEILQKFTEIQTKHKTLEGLYDAQKTSYDTLVEETNGYKGQLKELHKQVTHIQQENKQYKDELDTLQSIIRPSSSGNNEKSSSTILSPVDTARSSDTNNEVNTRLHQLVRSESIRIHNESALQIAELKEQLSEATKRAEHYEAIHLRHEEYMEEMRIRSEDELEAATNACAEAEERAVLAEKKLMELEQQMSDGKGGK